MDSKKFRPLRNTSLMFAFIPLISPGGLSAENSYLELFEWFDAALPYADAKFLGYCASGPGCCRTENTGT